MAEIPHTDNPSIINSDRGLDTTDTNHTLPQLNVEKSSLPLLRPWRTASLREKITRIRGSTFCIVFTITLAVFTDTFLYGIVVPVVPFAMVDRMGASEDTVQGSVSLSLTLYALGLIITSVLFGYLSDKLKGRKVIMLAGLVAVIGSTIILCLSRAVWLYQLGRFFQGMSAGVIWTVGLAVISDTATPDNIGYLMGFPGVGMSMGIVLGPTIGGAVYERVGYYPVYYVCFGVIAIDVALRFFMLEKSNLKSRLARLGYSDIELTPIEESTVETPEITEKHITENAPTANRRFKIPTFIYLLKYPRISVGALQAMALAWILGSLDATLTIHLQELFHFNSLYSGLVFLSLAVPSFLGPFVGIFVDKFGPRIPVTLGLILSFVFIMLLRIPSYHSTGQVVLMCAILTLLGASQTLIIGPSMADVGTSVAKEEAKSPGRFGQGKGFAQVYGLYNVGYSLGTLIGPLVAGAVKDSRGWAMSTVSTALVSLIVALPTVLITGGNLLYPWYLKKKTTAKPDLITQPGAEDDIDIKNE